MPEISRFYIVSLPKKDTPPRGKIQWLCTAHFGVSAKKGKIKALTQLLCAAAYECVILMLASPGMIR
jgi:hypothetical protein